MKLEAVREVFSQQFHLPQAPVARLNIPNLSVASPAWGEKTLLGGGIGAVLRDCQVGEGEIRTLMFITAKYKHCPDPRQASLLIEKPLTFYK